MVHKPELQFVTVGELHGTNEMPRIFYDLVCSTASAGRRVIVGLEFSAQADFDRYFNTTNQVTADRQLLHSVEWNGPRHDGRTSKAMLQLLARLRQLKQQGSIADVVAFKPELMVAEPMEGESPEANATRAMAAYEAQMARRLMQAAAREPGSIVVVLVGNLHARKNTNFLPFKPMGSYLPAERTVALIITHLGGFLWGTTPDKTGALAVKADKPYQRALHLNCAVDECPGFDGILGLGSRVSASSPANDVPK